MNSLIEQGAPGIKAWPNVALKDLCLFIRGVGFAKHEARSSQAPGHVPILRAGNIQRELDIVNDLVWVPSERVDAGQRLSLGDIAICLSSGSSTVVGKTAQLRVPFEGSVGAFCGIIRPRDQGSAAYLGFWFRSADYLKWRDEQARGANIQNLRFANLESLLIPWPPLSERQRITAILIAQMAAVEKARAAAETQAEMLLNLIHALLRESREQKASRSIPLRDCLDEVTGGVGADWRNYRVLGATRAGVAPAKEAVGKVPDRYKLVAPGTIFYNPMRILLGSIAFVDEGDEPGITSPDYVVFRTRAGLLHPRWFYFWLRSNAGVDLIRSLTRGAVRERLLFKRLSVASLVVPPWEAQVNAVNKIRVAAEARRLLMQDQVPVIEKLPRGLLARAFAGEL